MSETVPAAFSSQYGMLTNILVNVGFFVSFSCGLLLPKGGDDYENDEWWKFVSAMPAIAGFISVMLVTTFFPEEPLAWCVAKGRIQEARSLVRRVYRAEYSAELM